ncbi:metal ABC transporter solute-binding protein, Zn/Mn family [Iodobacter sp.]|uniref:metal ABC transporter solute-binding protein, Zn/Mn family n=1 Tax=Iodobacter sp. TaxID=1915058 RepID=UPI0025E1E32E|nr:zinc ABC transporter substrate-binding protein [Iodobacter sp.]
MRKHLLALLLVVSSVAQAAPLKVAASFSVLANLVQEIGGSRVEVSSLVGMDEDAHIWQARPADLKKLSATSLFFVNGLGFEGWLKRVEQASAYKGQVITVSKNIKPRQMAEAGHESHNHGHTDPHAWHDPQAVLLMVEEIKLALTKADPAGADQYAQNATRFKGQIAELDQKTSAAFAAIPAANRKLVTSHDALGYLGARYQLQLLPLQSISTEAEPSARQMAALIREIRKNNIRAVFAENISNPKLIMQIASETQAKVGPPLYTDALSKKAPSWLAMFSHNTQAILDALK